MNTVVTRGGWTARRFALVVAGFGLVCCLPGCRKETAQTEVDRVRLAYQHTMVTMDPHAHNDGVTGAVLAAIYQALVEIEPGAVVRPVLAERWITPNETTWRFTLRRGVLFHDGTVVRVADVVASIRRARFDPQSVLATYMDGIEDVQPVADEPMAFEVTTNGPFPLLLSRLAMIAIVPEVFDPAVPLGTGPYRCVSGDARQTIVLERWQEFWGDPPPVSSVVISMVPTDEELIALMLAGDVDVVGKGGLDFLVRFDLREVPGTWSVIRNPATTTTMVGLNLLHQPFDDVRVRMALDLALNRKKLVEEGLPEGSAVAAYSLVPEEVFGASPFGRDPEQDLDGALALLAQAGVGEGAVVRLQHSRVSPPLVELVADTFRRLGFTVEIEDMPYDVFYRSIEDASLEAYIFGWNFLFGDASDFLDGLVHTRDPERKFGQLNGTGFSDPHVDQWIEEAEREPDTGKRLQRLRSALAAVERERPYLPIYHASRQAYFREPFTMEARPGSWLQPQDILVRP